MNIFCFSYVRKSLLFALMLVFVVIPTHMLIGELSHFIFDLKEWLERKF
jgi:hypothetical protein